MNRPGGFDRDRDKPLFITLPFHADQTAFQVDILDPQSGQLTYPKHPVIGNEKHTEIPDAIEVLATDFR